MVADVCGDLRAIQPGDCVTIVFASGMRRAATVELATPTIIECWGYRFQPPAYAWVDPATGEAVHLAAPTEEERRDLRRRIARSRIAQLDWNNSDELTDSQLERIVAILDEPR